MNYTNIDECFDYLTKDNYFTISDIENRKDNIEKLNIDYDVLLKKVKAYRLDNQKIIFKYENKEFYLVESDKIKNQIKEINSFCESYKDINKDELDDMLNIEGYDSSTIEGANSVRLIAKKEPEDKNKTNSDNMILSNLKAIKQYKNKNGKISKDLICDIHKIISQNNMEKDYLIGKYRTQANEIANNNQKTIHTPPHPEIMEKMMFSLVEFINHNDKDTFYKIISFHFLFGFIHPFDDGNGRVVRILFSYLLKNNIGDVLYYAPLSNFINKSIKNYHLAFLNVERSDNNNKNRFDMSYFYYYILDIMIQSIDSLEDTIKTKFGVSVKRAKTLDEMYDSFEGIKPLSENEYESFYVPVYEKKINKFIERVQINKVYERMFFIAGQRGNGKSTILNILKKENKDFDKYDIKHIQAKDVFGYDDVNIVDILIVISLYLIDNASDKERKSLRETMRIELEGLAEINKGNIEKKEVSSSTTNKEISANTKVQAKVGLPTILESILPVSIEGSGTASYKSNDIMRVELKEIFNINKEKLVAIVNNVISLCKQDKEILLMLDGLEKTILEHKENIKDIFTKDVGLLRDLRCFKVFTIPIYLKEEVNQIDNKVLDFTMKLNDDKTIHNLYDNFNKVIEKRIDKDVINSLINKEAIKEAITNSAGNLRLLLSIIQESAITAKVYKQDLIDKEIVQEVCDEIGGGMSTTAQLNKTFLKKIYDGENISDDKEEKEKLANMIQAGLVFAYCNGKTYYKINPTILKSIED